MNCAMHFYKIIHNRDRMADYSAYPLADPDIQISRIRLLRLMIRYLLRKLIYTFLWIILGYGSGSTLSRSLNPANV